MDETRQMAIGDAPTVTWESLRYTGEAGRIAWFYALDPGGKRDVEITYDRETGRAHSHPHRPALEALAGFATMVVDEWAALRRLPFDADTLADVRDIQRGIVADLPHDERARAQLAAINREVARRASLGPIADAQRAGGDVRKAIASDLWSEN